MVALPYPLFPGTRVYLGEAVRIFLLRNNYFEYKSLCGKAAAVLLESRLRVPSNVKNHS